MSVVIDPNSVPHVLLAVVLVLSLIALLAMRFYRYWRLARIWKATLLDLPVAVILADKRSDPFLKNQVAHNLLQKHDLEVVDRAVREITRRGDGQSSTTVHEGILLEMQARTMSAGHVAVVLSEHTETKQYQLEERYNHRVWHIAHALLRPVANMRSYLQGIASGDTSDYERWRRDLAAAQEQCEHLDRLIHDLAVYASPDGNKEPTDLAEIASKAVLQLVDKARARGVNILRRNGPSPLPLHRVNPDAWQDVFRNLIDNAIKYGREGGEIVITMRQEASGLLIVVADDGPGIEPRCVPFIFDPTFRCSNAKGTPGTGMGLAKVAATVEHHGGTIKCASTLGRGTTFTITLPVIDATGSASDLEAGLQ